MAVHTDIPTRAQIDRLLEHREAASVSIYLSTDRIALDRSDQIELTNALREAVTQLEAAGTDRGEVAAIVDVVEDLAGDDGFWQRQADSLAVFVTPRSLATFRLPNRLPATVEVSDRFHVMPLLRAVTFPQAAWVLALSRNAHRLVEVGPSGPPRDVPLPELPMHVWDATEGRAVAGRERSYVRELDHALRGALSGSDLPLILAATEEIAAIYHRMNTYPHLVGDRLAGNPDQAGDAELADRARSVLDGLYAAQLADLAALLDQRASQGRSATDVSDIARLATLGAVETLLVDMGGSVPGTIDEAGAVSFDDAPGADRYGVLDEVARRVHLAGGRVMVVRGDDVPGGGPAAALLRYAI